jgi:type IX secretion system PorP/SprF family membrane protein
MLIRKTVLLTAFITTVLTTSQAQDLHISQYQSAPMHLNPAMTGMAYDGSMASLHYRTQWAPILGNDNAFKTLSTSFEYRKHVGKVDFMGYGLGVWQDKAAGITATQAKFSLSYARQLAGDNNVQHFLVGGGDVSFMQRRLDFSDRRWVGQYDDNGGYDPNRLAPPFEFQNRANYDASVGIAWYSLLKHNNYLAAGLSAQHLNRADFSLNKRTVAGNLYTRYSAHFDSEIHLKQRISVQPSVLFMVQGPSLELTPGASIKFRFRDQLYEDASFRIGGWLRLVNYLEAGIAPDAFIAFARLDWRRFSFGFSYDFNVSGLRASNPANNAIELLLSYRFAPKGTKKLYNISPRYL